MEEPITKSPYGKMMKHTLIELGVSLALIWMREELDKIETPGTPWHIDNGDIVKLFSSDNIDAIMKTARIEKDT